MWLIVKISLRTGVNCKKQDETILKHNWWDFETYLLLIKGKSVLWNRGRTNGQRKQKAAQEHCHSFAGSESHWWFSVRCGKRLHQPRHRLFTANGR